MEMLGDSSPVIRSNRVANRHSSGGDDGGGENECNSKGLLWLSAAATFQESGRKRLMSHRDDVAGRVAIPESWGQEKLMREWMEHGSFDSMLSHKGISSAREALMAQARRSSASSQRLRIESSC